MQPPIPRDGQSEPTELSAAESEMKGFGLARLAHMVFTRIHGGPFTGTEGDVRSAVMGTVKNALKADATLESVGELVEKLRDGKIDEIRQSYFNHLYRRGIWADFIDNKGPLKGKILDVLPGGELVLLTECYEERKYGFKEIGYLR